MKKIIILLFFIGLSAGLTAQVNLFKPVPKNLFAKAAPDTVLTAKGVYIVQALEKSSQWILRLTGGVLGVSYYRDKETKEVISEPLDAICAGISYLHYKEADGLPFNDFGFSAMLLQNVQRAGMGLGIYGTYNTGPIGLLNIGTHYDFSLKVFMLDTALTWHF
jgi:hypothetical protein